MTFTTLIGTEELSRHLGEADWAIVDTRFSLDQPERGRADYLRAHIPGAVYAHLNDDLSAPHVPGKTGRHPLPTVEAVSETFAGLGIGPAVQVVVYDDANGSIAARLWWMLRWLGHSAVAVLDGGWARWQREGRPVRHGSESRQPRPFQARPQPALVVDARDVEAIRSDPSYRLVDSRSADRYRGEHETIDPVAGHIPGAISGPFAENLEASARFRSVEELRERFQQLLGDLPAERAVFYCGSGVTAAHNLLALAHAGFGDGRLYAGSWSDWITDPRRPTAPSPDQ